MKTLKLTCGTVTLKPFLDRKTMRAYRAAMMANSKMQPVKDDKGKQVFDEDTHLPKTEIVFDPAQMDASNDALVRGIVESCDEVKLNDEFFDSMSNEDFETILAVALSLMKKKEDEKKSS